MSAIEFVSDEEWLRWAGENPEGYALNVRAAHDPNYAVLHRAACWTISSRRDEVGAYCERSYRKVASIVLADLVAWSRKHGRPDGTFSKECGHCRPLG